jgi:hypothetical protein
LETYSPNWESDKVFFAMAREFESSPILNLNKNWDDDVVASHKAPIIADETAVGEGAFIMA